LLGFYLEEPDSKESGFLLSGIPNFSYQF